MTQALMYPQSEPFDIQSGFIYGDIPAVQVQLSEVTLIYRNVSNGVSRIGVTLPDSVSGLLQKRFQTVFNDHCETNWNADYTLPMHPDQHKNLRIKDASKVLFLSTPYIPDLIDTFGNPVRSIMNLPLGSKVSVKFSANCYRNKQNELCIWRELSQVKLLEPFVWRSFTPCDPDDVSKENIEN